MGRRHRVIGGSKASWWEEQDLGNERGLRGIRGRIGEKMGVWVGTERGFRDRKGGSGEKGDVVVHGLHTLLCYVRTRDEDPRDDWP